MALLSDKQPPVPLGHSGTGTKYRLVPDVHQLLPHCNDKRTIRDPRNNRRFVSGAILCLRTRNEPYPGPEQASRDASSASAVHSTIFRTSSASSTISITCDTDSGYSSTSSSDHGYNYLIHQLGAIQYLPSMSDPNEDDDDWERTGFILVVRIGLDGRPAPNGLYAILDVFPLADEYNDLERRVSTPLSKWEREDACRLLVGDARQPSAVQPAAFSCARLASVLSLDNCDDEFRTRLAWTQRVEGAVDILPVAMPDSNL